MKSKIKHMLTITEKKEKERAVYLLSFLLPLIMFVAILATPVLDSVSDLINYSEYYDRIGGCDLRGILTGASGFEPGYGLLLVLSLFRFIIVRWFFSQSTLFMG